jgi:hypothetical protein
MFHRGRSVIATNKHFPQRVVVPWRKSQDGHHTPPDGCRASTIATIIQYPTKNNMKFRGIWKLAASIFMRDLLDFIAKAF